MFDDHKPQSAGGQPPVNLPVGEPEDILAGTDLPAPEPAAAPAGLPTAVSAGKLQPKVPSTPAPAPAASSTNSLPPMPDEDIPPPPVAAPAVHVPPASLTPSTDQLVPPATPAPAPYALKEPKLGKFIFRMVLLVIVVFVVIGLLWAVFAFFSGNDDGGDATPIVDDGNQILFDFDEGDDVVDDTTPVDTGRGDSDDAILFGQPLDTDADGLTDSREQELGTDADNWDSDSDQLSDGDEVIIWKTDPLDPDTDGDSFLDGQEIKAGYSPSGPGKIFEPPVEDSAGAGSNDVF